MKTFEEVVSGLSGGQKLAILRKVARGLTGDETQVEQVFEGVLTGAYKLVVQDATIKLVDRHGRWIPLAGMSEEVVDANRDFHLVQPSLDYAAVHARYTRYMPDHEFVSAEQFQQYSLELIDRVKGDRQVANLTEGVHLPVCFPKCEVADYGTILENLFLEATGRAYTEAFPGRTFENWRRGTLAGQVSIIAGTRHERLLSAMRQGPVAGVYFPTCLQGFSIPADRAMARQFPEDMILTGAFEPSLGFVGYSEVLGRDFNTPALDCAAVSWQDTGDSLYLGPRGGSLDFGSRGLDARGRCSGGVLVLRQGT